MPSSPGYTGRPFSPCLLYLIVEQKYHVRCKTFSCSARAKQYRLLRRGAGRAAVSLAAYGRSETLWHGTAGFGAHFCNFNSNKNSGQGASEPIRMKGRRMLLLWSIEEAWCVAGCWAVLRRATRYWDAQCFWRKTPSFA